ncbi:hypothetical protein Pfo_008084 [Paulownia fortunei]|nr:hypothetical protein Pfo_008084 [Paulownia fortunei]
MSAVACNAAEAYGVRESYAAVSEKLKQTNNSYPLILVLLRENPKEQLKYNTQALMPALSKTFPAAEGDSPHTRPHIAWVLTILPRIAFPCKFSFFFPRKSQLLLVVKLSEF